MITRSLIAMTLLFTVSCGKSSSDDSNPVPAPEAEEAPLALTDFGETTLYLRGSMNGWSADEVFAFTVVDGCYSLSATLEAGDHTFKIADEAWAEVNIGSLEETDFAVILNEEVQLSNNPADGGPLNLTLSLEGETSLMFKLCVYETTTGFPSFTVSEKIQSNEG